MPFAANINFRRSPKLVCIDTATMTLSGYYGKKRLAKVQLTPLPGTDYLTEVEEVVEEFRMSINAPLKGKTKK